MDTKAKLVELLKNIPQVNHYEAQVHGIDYVFECAADFLIDSGVAMPVYCCECKHWLPEDLERCEAMKSEPYGLCNRYPQRTDWQDITYEDDFCSYGEKREV